MKNLPSWLPIPSFNSWMSAVLLATVVTIATNLAVPIMSFFSFLLSFLTWFVYLFAIIINLFPDFIKTSILWIFQIIYGFFSHIFSFLMTVSSPLLLILPIMVIAFADHFFNLLCDRYFPDLRPAEMEKITGYFPRLVSWWEGCYGLLVIMIALLSSDIFLSFFPMFAFSHDFSSFQPASTNRLYFWYYTAIMLFSQPLYNPIARLFIWIIVAAYLYHFEATVRKHLIAVNERQ